MILSTGVQGYYRITATNAITGQQRVVADWFPNLITDLGLNEMGYRAVYERCMVGSGQNTPTVTDTQLQSFVAVNDTVISNASGAQSTAPYYGWFRRTFRFNPGTAAGNLSEIGIGWNQSSTWRTFSRALILDSNGFPTTITILANEFLDVTYELRCYPPTGDQIFNINLSGNTYQCTVRAAFVTSANYWAPQLNSAVSLYSAGSSFRAHSGTIGAITTGPSGTSASGSVNNLPYDNNSMTKRGYSEFGLDSANFAGGIQSFVFSANHLGEYQIGFSPAIPKDNTKTFRIDIGVSWARRL